LLLDRRAVFFSVPRRFRGTLREGGDARPGDRGRRLETSSRADVSWSVSRRAPQPVFDPERGEGR